MTVKYAPYYCEENVWWLCQLPALQALRRRVIFLSNPARACALFAQRAAPRPDAPVLWDYHVVLWVEDAAPGAIWDLDSTLGAPVPLAAWLEATVAPALGLSEHLHARFRVIDADRYVATFSSDRAHMADARGVPHAAWPPWPPIRQGPPNLHRFVDMEEAFVGEVWNLAELYRNAGARPGHLPSAPRAGQE